MFHSGDIPRHSMVVSKYRGFVDRVYSGPFAIVEVSGGDGVFRKVATK